MKVLAATIILGLGLITVMLTGCGEKVEPLPLKETEPPKLSTGFAAEETAAPLLGESDGAMFSTEGVGEDLVLTIPGPGKVKLKMKKIPAGAFVMGSPMGEKGRDDDEGPMHQVVISKPFYMAVYELTQAQWEAVMGTYPSVFNGKPAHPVEKVSWEDCQKFVEKLNGMGIGTFRLPTEAEWEYACRAGTKTGYSFGDEVAKLKEYANYVDTPKWGNNSTAPVGSFKPNPWGLYDMHGNVWEWCQDRYEEGYSSRSVADPVGPSSGSIRVYRGGSWLLRRDLSFRQSLLELAVVPLRVLGLPPREDRTQCTVVHLLVGTSRRRGRPPVGEGETPAV